LPLKEPPRPLFWVGSSRKELREFPEPVKDVIGHGLFIAQLGGKHEDAKPLKGYGGAGVLELVEDFHGDTYRAVYTVKFARAIYVLHVFQKKSKQGSKTPHGDLDRIKERLKRAEQDHAKWSRSGA
jgi:phage-related protein